MVFQEQELLKRVTILLPTVLGNIFGQKENTEQNWTRARNFDFCSLIIFDCYYQKFVSEGDAGD